LLQQKGLRKEQVDHSVKMGSSISPKNIEQGPKWDYSSVSSIDN